MAGHTERKETKGTRLPERHAFSLSLFLSGPTLKTSPISQCHQKCQCHQHWLLAGSSQFARVVKGVNLRSTSQLRMGSNPIAHMSGWSHSARKRKLALSPGVALRSTQVRMGSAASLTCGWRHTERKETTGTRGLPERHAFSLSLFLSGPTLKTSPISQCHQECQCDQQWLLVGSSQFARVVKGVNLRSTARKCAWVRTP